MIISFEKKIETQNPVCILDIGSNSIRFVIYENKTRAADILLSEKIFAGLGKNILKTKKLDHNAVEIAYRAFQKFRNLADYINLKHIYAFATAAVRMAEDASHFIENAEKILCTEIRILSGEEEAFYSALGVVSGFHNPDGVMGDMGGGSLEFTHINRNVPQKTITLPFGGLSLKILAGSSIPKAQEFFKQELKKIDLLKEGYGRTFYAVGGIWRNLAVLHMRAINHPLCIVHHYRMNIKESFDFLNKIAFCPLEKIKNIKKIPKERYAFLHYGALMLLEIIEKMNPAEIIFSEYGVREGFLYSILSLEEQKKDPLYAKLQKMGILYSFSEHRAHDLIAWAEISLKAFELEETVQDERYRKAACFLIDLGLHIHKKYKALYILSVIKHAAIPGLDHAGRAYIMLIFFYRYKKSFKREFYSTDLFEYLPQYHQRLACFLGYILQIADYFSTLDVGIIRSLRWQKDCDKTLKLMIPKENSEILSQKIEKTLSSLMKLSGQEIKIIIQEE